MTANPTVSRSVPPSRAIDAIQAPLPGPTDVWHTSSEAPLNLTYRFADRQPSDLWVNHSGWTVITPAQQKVIRLVLNEYASVINLTFTETNSADPDFNLVVLLSATEATVVTATLIRPTPAATSLPRH
jgi:hypothetical protein